MIWSRLKNMKCPKCNGGLFHNTLSCSYACPKCAFKIDIKRFDELVADLYRGKKVSYEDNFEALQNLGHKGVSEDFSDSPALR